MSTQKKIIIIIAVVILVLVVIKVIGALNRKSEVEEMSMPTEMMIPPTETTTTETETATPAVSTTPQPAQQLQQTQPALAPAPTVPAKMTNENIQRALKAAGYDPGPIDGKIGKKTKAAIIDFQKANGLTADGKVGPKTWTKLSGFLSSSNQ